MLSYIGGKSKIGKWIVPFYDKNIMYDLQANNEYNYWDGSHYDTDYNDTEVTDERVESIEKVKRR